MGDEFTIMDKMNPGFVHQYICEDERNQEHPTVFFLKNLSVWEYKSVEEQLATKGIGSSNFATLQFGLIGWDNFKLSDTEDISFSLQNISCIPSRYQTEIANHLFSIATISKELENELLMVAYWQDYYSKLDENKAKEWNCDYCLKKNLQNVRNCEGKKENICMNTKCSYRGEETKCPKCGDKMRPPFKLVLNKNLGVVVDRCPLAILTARAVKIANLVAYTESSHSLPFGSSAFEQTNFFYIARTILLGEQNAILKAEYKDIASKSKSGRGGSGKKSPGFVPKS